MLMHAIAHGGVRTPRESALKVDSGRKIPRRTEEPILRRRRAGPMLYQLSYIPTPTKNCITFFFFISLIWLDFHVIFPTGSPSHGGDGTVYVKDINQPSLPTPFDFVLVSVSVFMAFSTVFHSINSPDNSPFFHSILPVLSQPYWSFQLHISL